MNSPKLNPARIISIMGHPLVLGNVYVMFMSFTYWDKQTALFISLLVFGLVTTPIIWNNLRKMKRGEYTNFDVSDHVQRKGFYPFALTLFLCLLTVFWIVGISGPALHQTAVFLGLLLVMALISLKTKASLHVAVACYIAISLLTIGYFLCLAMLTVAFAVAWSRLKLNRHTVTEVIAGSVVGIAFGILSLLV